MGDDLIQRLRDGPDDFEARVETYRRLAVNRDIARDDLLRVGVAFGFKRFAPPLPVAVPGSVKLDRVYWKAVVAEAEHEVLVAAGRIERGGMSGRHLAALAFGNSDNERTISKWRSQSHYRQNVDAAMNAMTVLPIDMDIRWQCAAKADAAQNAEARRDRKSFKSYALKASKLARLLWADEAAAYHVRWVGAVRATPVYRDDWVAKFEAQGCDWPTDEAVYRCPEHLPDSEWFSPKKVVWTLPPRRDP